ncbi:MAG TPA: DUF6364 family protein [Thermoanaerobaculia bacterium]|jgi:hypothetical protein|nr:DUF6364 family protein [Thermoanaerobaculia bacterium]
MQTKLTLRLEDSLIRAGKRQAERRGKSLSALVADFITVLDRAEPNPDDLPPIVKRLKGIAQAANPDDYHRYLEEKYR